MQGGARDRWTQRALTARAWGWQGRPRGGRRRGQAGAGNAHEGSTASTRRVLDALGHNAGKRGAPSGGLRACRWAARWRGAQMPAGAAREGARQR